MAVRRHFSGSVCGAVLLACSAPALAASFEFRSVAESAAVLYDAPSAKSRKLYVVSRGYPLEILVGVEGWSKVRDASGELTWIENRYLADRRTVMIKVPLVQVRGRADDNAAIVFQAQQNVIFELLEVAGAGWLHVRHRDGQAGFIKASQVWGA